MGIEFWIYLAVLTVITYFTRYAFFSHSLNINLGERFSEVLTYAPPAILTTLWISIVFDKKIMLDSLTFQTSYIWGALIAIGLTFFSKNSLLIVGLSYCAFMAIGYYSS